MEQITLELEKRDVLGKQVRQLRREGMVPAVIHDHGKESTHVMAPYLLMHKTFLKAGKNHPIELIASGKKYMALIRDVDFEPRRNQLTHVVFNAVKANETVDAEVPVEVKYAEGNDASPAERAGLVVLHQLDTVEVEALPRDLPDAIYFDGEKLVSAGDQITVADLVVPKGVTIKTEEEHVVATAFEPSALAAANEEAGGDAEVINDVPAVNGDASSDTQTQADEIRPGGKKEFEDKSQGRNPEKK